MKNVLFVCTGNTCRSPMAEAIFNMICEREKISALASSCGITTFDGLPASENAVIAVRELFSLNLENHLSRKISKPIADSADLIFVMTPAHRDALAAAFPEIKDKIYLPTKPVADPYMCDLSVYRQCALDLQKEILCFIEQRIK